MTVLQALQHPQVLLLAAAYFFVVTASYGVEFFLPKILEKWYDLPLSKLTWVVLIPPIGGLVGQLAVGWSSDRTGERRLHGSVPIYMGAARTRLHAVDPRIAVIQHAVGHGGVTVHHGTHGAQGVHARVLGDAEPDLDRGGRRGKHRLDQLGRQPRRIRRPFLLGFLERPDSLVLAWSSLPLLLDDRLGHDHIHPWSGPTAPVKPRLDEEPDAIIEPV